MSLELHYNVYGCFRRPAADIELAARAVDAGFGGVWVGDHFMPWIDSRPYTHHPFPWLGALMAEVPDVPVGTSVTCPMLRYRPPLVAQAIATLDNMFPGRFHLGIGVGEALNEQHFLEGEWPGWHERAEMLIEAIQIMRRLWNSDEFISFEGEHFSYDDIKLYTRPQAPIDLHWAAWGPTSCQYAGTHADHVLTITSPQHIEERIIPNFERGRSKAEQRDGTGDITTEFTANVGDPDTLVAEIRDRGEFIPDDTELDNPDPRSTQAVADRRLEKLSDDELIDQYRITTDPEPIIEDLKRYEQAGVTRVIVGSVCGDPYRTIELFEEEILPVFE